MPLNSLIIASSPTLLKFYLKKFFPDKKIKILEFENENFFNELSFSRTKNLFEKSEDIIVIKNFFKNSGHIIQKNFIFWEEKFPNNETINFYLRNFNLKIIELDEKNLLKEFIKETKVKIPEKLFEELLNLYIQDQNGIESFISEIEKISVFKEVDYKILKEIFFPPFWLKEAPIWNNLENSLVSLFFLKRKKEFLIKIKKFLKQNIPFEIFLGEFNFVLKTIAIRKIFNLNLPLYSKKIQDRFDKYWSYEEIKRLIYFLSEADIKIKRNFSFKEILEELLKFI